MTPFGASLELSESVRRLFCTRALARPRSQDGKSAQNPRVSAITAPRDLGHVKVGLKFFIWTGADCDFRPGETLHNAHKDYLRVLCPYHPYYGQTPEVFGAGGGLGELVYVRMPNNTTRGIPAWMFDESICASIRCADRLVAAELEARWNRALTELAARQQDLL